ncbi:hypothetical protein ACFLR3_02690 [Campylobacterota bacterium]
MTDINEPYRLIQNIVDGQENFILIIEHEKPILMNKACCDFFGVKSFDEYSKNFGDFMYSFVPHPAYFNMGKLEEGQGWTEAIASLDEKDKIVSMLNTSHEPRAFSVKLDSSHPLYAVLSLTDISANLIKRIMIENDVSVDKESGAYNKEYFLHTAEILQDGAAYNEKEIGLTMIKIGDPEDDTLKSLVSDIKGSIRENDMLVKYSSNTLLLAYLVDKEDNAVLFSKKLQAVVMEERSRGKSFNLSVTLVKKKEKLTASIKRLNESISEESINKLQLI